ncbi:MAG: dihydroorotate dehydrogenase electron transfer subunit [Gemmiger sp.]|nr:dihydroorotate dehydrogenase electron transfer subunit [Gemmiger sp.]
MNATSCNTAVLAQQRLQPDICRLTVAWAPSAGGHIPHAGQFFMLRAWPADQPPLLARPISVHDFDPATGALTFLYQIKGQGTTQLAALQPGDTLSLTGPCGNGFDAAALAAEVAGDALPPRKIAVVGGGIGVAPLLLLCRELAAAGVKPDLFAGYRDTPYALESFVGCCNQIYLATDSGVAGYHGLITGVLHPAQYARVLTCGPMVMMRGVYALCAEQNTPCLASLEGKMACGLGACLGCTCHTKIGPKTVCKEGPVFDAGEVFAE